jgi:hypothetical protein
MPNIVREKSSRFHLYRQGLEGYKKLKAKQSKKPMKVHFGSERTVLNVNV